MPAVAGIDSSTQSCKVVVCDAETGEVLHRGRAPHSEGTEADPEAWWQALRAAGEGLLDDVDAIAVAGQQHGLVALDDAGEPVRPALLWNDTRSAGAAAGLVRELGGAQAWADAVGTVPVAAITAAKLRWLADHEPAADRTATATATAMLPHDWLTWRLCGGPSSGAEPVTDRGDASGTGYWSPADGRYRTDLLRLAFRGRTPRLPRVLGPYEPAGRNPGGTLVAAGTGDNMAAALGLAPGDAVISLGTSGTAFARSTRPTADPTGAVAGFADATGQFLPLVCTLNAARVLSSTARMLGTDLDGLDRLARQAGPGADGIVLLPYPDGERTPDLPDAALLGMRTANMHPHNLARAAVEGMLCGLAHALDALRSQGTAVQRLLLIGGAARSPVVGETAAQVFGMPVTVPRPDEYAALGAARQAAWTLNGTDSPPAWNRPDAVRHAAPGDGGASGRRIRDAYAEARRALHGR
ncbi:xylulokinase [Streptomyces roseoverticillatus]|uniref:xylulokinase n=1 Tax=Streptomyces roseoverticillatus TaxID=66429 RepID=UPI0004BE62C1|nr:FGGY family carbohydrate kinase [Streptomyces roseoverticillatus]